MFKRFAVICLVLVGLSGCAHQEWMKPGAGPADLGRDKYECMQSAMASAPPVMANEVVWSGGQHDASWNGKTGHEQGNNGGGRVEAVDANAGNRAALTTSCMEARGWQLITVKD